MRARIQNPELLAERLTELIVWSVNEAGRAGGMSELRIDGNKSSLGRIRSGRRSAEFELSFDLLPSYCVQRPLIINSPSSQKSSTMAQQRSQIQHAATGRWLEELNGREGLHGVLFASSPFNCADAVDSRVMFRCRRGAVCYRLPAVPSTSVPTFAQLSHDFLSQSAAQAVFHSELSRCETFGTSMRGGFSFSPGEISLLSCIPFAPLRFRTPRTRTHG